MRRLGCLTALALSLWAAAPDPAAPLPPPSTWVRRRLSLGESHRYTVPLRPDQYFQVVAAQDAVDLVLRLRAPDATLLLQADAARLGPERLSWIALLPGPHVLEVSPRRPAGSGPYRLKVEALRSPLPSDRNLAAAAQSFSQGEQLRARGATSQSMEAYRQTLSLSTAAADPRGQALALHRLCLVHQDLAQPESALDACNRALPLWRALRDAPAEAATLIARGMAYRQLGDNRKTPDFQRALTLSRALADSVGVADALLQLGIDSDGAGRRPAALRCLERALALYRSARVDEGVTAALSRLAMVHQGLGRPQTAVALLLELLQQSRTAGDRPGESRVLQDLGLLHEMSGRYVQSLDYLRQALAIRHTQPDQRAIASTLAAMGNVEISLGRLDDAREHLASAVAIQESFRRTLAIPVHRLSYFALKEGYYKKYMDVLVQIQRQRPSPSVLAAAFEAGEHIRARTLMESLDPSAEPLTLSQIRREALDDDTVLVEYALDSTRRSYMWAVSRREIVVFDLPHSDYIEGSARRLHQILSDAARWTRDPRAAYRQYWIEASALSRMVIAPAAGLLSGKRVLAATEGALDLVPFAVLPDPGAPAAPLASNHEVVHIPSASALALIRRRDTGRPAPEKLLAVLADPVFDAADPRLGSPRLQKRPQPNRRSAPDAASRLDVGRLPYSRREAERIVAFAPPGSALQALDLAASRATVVGPELTRYRILHFATHGVFNPRDPDWSGLVLSLVDEHGRPQDGLLRLRDICQLHFPASLVVLSGCRTGLGVDVNSEGPIGLARGFLSAGASRVVVSLWQVDDEATAGLMEAFYQAMLGPARLPPAAALRHAQLEISRQPRWQSPYYWAGFVLQGDWR